MNLKSVYPLGNKITKENYQALKSLAESLSGNEFEKATGFKRGVHNRVRRFRIYEEYKQDERNRVKKYSGRNKKRAVTLRDVYEKLLEIEKKLG